MCCQNYRKNILPIGKLNMNALSSLKSPLKFWNASCRVEVMLQKHDESKHWLHGKELYQSHPLFSHCIVSFALLSQHTGERECRSELWFVMSSPSHLSSTSPRIPSQFKEILLRWKEVILLDYSAANHSWFVCVCLFVVRLASQKETRTKKIT